MFTGDASGDWLYRAMHRAGFASQPQAVDRNDGLRLIDCAITAVGHCAPPDNKPTREELANCRTWFEETLDLVPARVYMALGAIAWDGLVRQAKSRGWLEGRAPKFGHGVVVALNGAATTGGSRTRPQAHALADKRWLVGSYHPSRQNTNTGVLTEEMLDAAFATARRLVNGGRISRRRS
jgi:uracil-DNA glycosylase